MRVGIVGAGQLGRMLALAGLPLGVRSLFLAPAADTPARALAEQVVASYDDEDGQHRLAEHVDVVTYELENLPAQALYHLAEHRAVFPPPRALETMQDRLEEKRLCRLLDIPVPPFRRVDSLEDLTAAAGDYGLPFLVKARRAGYDGRGQRVVRTPADIPEAFAALGGRSLLAEPYVRFDREVAVIAVRARDGAMRFYPLVENHHEDGILRWSRPLADSADGRRAAEYARRVAEHFGYGGVLTLELFVVGDRLLLNEMAPRVHNSGHWTIEGAETSQFENHLRAGLDYPLGATAARGASLMVNLIGEPPDVRRVTAVAGAHVHLYGKPPGPRRKIGHVTLIGADPAELAVRSRDLAAALGFGAGMGGYPAGFVLDGTGAA